MNEKFFDKNWREIKKPLDSCCYSNKRSSLLKNIYHSVKKRKNLPELTSMSNNENEKKTPLFSISEMSESYADSSKPCLAYLHT